MAGFIQLISAGTEQEFLNNDSQVDFFHIIYRRHTNFYMDPFVLNGNDIYFKKSNVEFIIPKNGDLLSCCYLQLDLQENNYELFYSNRIINTFNFDIFNFYDTYYLTDYSKQTIESIDILKINLNFLTIYTEYTTQQLTSIIKITSELELQKVNDKYDINEQYNYYSFEDTTLITTDIKYCLYINILIKDIQFKKIKFVRIDLLPLKMHLELHSKCLKKIICLFFDSQNEKDNNKIKIQMTNIYLSISNENLCHAFLIYIYNNYLDENLEYSIIYDKINKPRKSILQKQSFESILQYNSQEQIFKIYNTKIFNYNPENFGNLIDDDLNGYSIENYNSILNNVLNLKKDIKFFLIVSNLKDMVDLENVIFNNLTYLQKKMFFYEKIKSFENINNTKQLDLNRIIYYYATKYAQNIYLKKNITTFQYLKNKTLLNILENSEFAIDKNLDILNIKFNYCFDENSKITFYTNDFLTLENITNINFAKNNEINNITDENLKSIIFNNCDILDVIYNLHNNSIYITTQDLTLNNTENYEYTNLQELKNILENTPINFIDYYEFNKNKQYLIDSEKTTITNINDFCIQICNYLLYNNLESSDFTEFMKDENMIFYNRTIIDNLNRITKNYTEDINDFLNGNNFYINFGNKSLLKQKFNELVLYLQNPTNLSQTKLLKNAYDYYFKNITNFETYENLCNEYFESFQKYNITQLIPYFAIFNKNFNKNSFQMFFDIIKNNFSNKPIYLTNIINIESFYNNDNNKNFAYDNTKTYLENVILFFGIKQNIKSSINDGIMAGLMENINVNTKNIANLVGGNINLNSSYTMSKNQLKSAYSQKIYKINKKNVNTFTPFLNLNFKQIKNNHFYLFNLFWNAINYLYNFNNYFINNVFQTLNLKIYDKNILPIIQNLIDEDFSSRLLFLNKINNICNELLSNEVNNNTALMNSYNIVGTTEEQNTMMNYLLLNNNIKNSKIMNLLNLLINTYDINSSDIIIVLKSILEENNISVELFMKIIYENYGSVINKRGIMKCIELVNLYMGDMLIDNLTTQNFAIGFQIMLDANKYKTISEMLGTNENNLVIDSSYPYIVKLSAYQYILPLSFFFKDRMNAIILIANMYEEIRIQVLTNSETLIISDFNVKILESSKPQFKTSLSLDYILLERDERKNLSLKINDNLIERHNNYEIVQSILDINVSPNNDLLNLNFEYNLTNLVKEIFWDIEFYLNDYEKDVIQNINDFIIGFIFTIDGIKRDGTIPNTIIPPTKQELLTGTYTTKYASYIAINSFMNTYKYNTRSNPNTKYYSYSFAFTPETLQPTGAINMSTNLYYGIQVVLDKTQMLKYLQNNDINNLNKITIKMNLYTLEYNILRYQSGLSGLLYVN